MKCKFLLKIFKGKKGFGKVNEGRGSKLTIDKGIKQHCFRIITERKWNKTIKPTNCGLNHYRTDYAYRRSTNEHRNQGLISSVKSVCSIQCCFISLMHVAAENAYKRIKFKFK